MMSELHLVFYIVQATYLIGADDKINTEQKYILTGVTVRRLMSVRNTVNTWAVKTNLPGRLH